MASLVDTNVLVYRVDPRDPRKQRIATDLLRATGSRDLYIAHQAVVEFVSVVTRPLEGGAPLLTPADARRFGENLLSQFDVLYPDEALLRLAFRGAAAYQLSWYDAHMWAYAEHHGLDELLSEDFEHGRLYGSVRVVDPFVPDAWGDPAALADRSTAETMQRLDAEERAAGHPPW